MNRTQRTDDDRSQRGREADGATGGSADRRGPVGTLHAAVGNQALQRQQADDRDTRGPVAGRSSAGDLCSRCARRHRAGEPLNCTECERALDRGDEEPAASAGPDGRVQPKLAVGRPDTAAEREAERVATDVLRAPEAVSARSGEDTRSGEGAQSGGSARSSGACDACTPGGTVGSAVEIRRTPGDDGPALDGARERRLRSATRGGRPLPAAERSFFESRFGRDFSDVRVHTGGEADGLARSLGARAFTLGTDVVFRSGEYSPGTDSGRRLLAHELTHVVQQDDAGTVARQADGDGPRFRDCTPAAAGVGNPNERLLAATRTATTRVDRAVGVVERYIQGETPEHVRQAFAVHFSMPTYPQMRAILDTYREARRVLARPDAFPGRLICNTNEAMTCDPDRRGWKAYAACGGPYIHVCPEAFTGDRPLPEVLLHEAVHVAGRCTDCYADDPCYDALPSSKAVQNADSYALFAAAVADGGHQ